MATNPLGRSRKPKKSGTTIVIEFVFSTLLLLLYGAWMLMLAVGVAHHEWLPQLPTVGYGTSLLIMWMLSGVANATRRINLDD